MRTTLTDAEEEIGPARERYRRRVREMNRANRIRKWLSILAFPVVYLIGVLLSWLF